MELWFMGQGYEDHLVTPEDAILDVDKVQWKKIDAQLCSVLWIASLKEEFLTLMPFTNSAEAQQIQTNKFFMVLTLIGLRPDLESVRDQILASPSVSSLDDVFARLLRLSSTQTLSTDGPSDSSVLASQTNSRGGRSGNWGRGQRPQCTYCNKFGHTRDHCYQLHGRPPRTAHIAQSSDPLLSRLDFAASSTSQSITLTSSDYDAYLRYQAATSASVAQTANGSQTMAKGIGLAHPLPSLPLHSVLYAPECPFNLISISKITRTLNCSITFSNKSVILQDRSTGKTIGIERESQGLYHLTSPLSPAACISTDAPLLIHNRLGHPSLSKFQKMVPRFSTLSSLACESCQLGKHTRVSFLKHLNNRAKSPFELVHTDVWGPCRTASTLGFQYFVTFIDDYSRSCYLINRMPSSILHDQIPHSLLFPTQPLYFLPPHVFGCTCFVHTLTPGQDKLFAKATKCIFLGYSQLQKGYRCYSPDTHRYFLSADVTFFEDSPLFSSSESLPISEVLSLPYISPPSDGLSRPLQVYHRRHRVVAPPLSSTEVPDDSPPVPPISPTSTLSSTDHLPMALRKGNRSTRNPNPIYNFLSYHRLSSSYSAFVSTLSSIPLPKSTSEALSHPGKFTVGCRWVYTVKVGPDGQVDRLKARLVAKGYTQIYGCDYGDTFSPVAKIASVRLFLSMAAMCHWPLYQLDIKNDFLHGELLEEVYMEQPPSFVAQEESGLVCKLRRSLYGLKQSPRAWFESFSSVVQEFGMLRSSDQECIQRLKQHLFNHFQTKDLGKLKYFLGLEIAQSSSGVVMSQRRGASKRSWEISTTCRQTELPHHHSARHLFSYADWAGSPSDRRSTSGYCVFIGGNLISWKIKKQDVVVRSSAEAKYRAMALATCELIWLRQLLQELRFGKMNR
ncbi:Retrovirus-related Pol polyprotein from transposon TNT 1-94 [Vitis vinifera]|uniref:Retrovirus-related Pol polyprotein from transposon TNT 1-94 n=1 Tax=Vitis vinifera TaxID=29760 RepID=A0A438I816_VITVI|nr:Retrovirus-related Pol polyprotein from transposon TNT 1-94 [Vitis vinifera]